MSIKQAGGYTMTLEERLNDWVKKVLEAKADTRPGCVDTLRMMTDVDNILAEEFGHDPIFVEALCDR